MDGLSMNQALMKCRVVFEERVTEAGSLKIYWLEVGDRVIELGTDKIFADRLQFVIARNAVAFDDRSSGMEPMAFIKTPEDSWK